jgi:hypothetical protein
MICVRVELQRFQAPLRQIIRTGLFESSFNASLARPINEHMPTRPLSQGKQQRQLYRVNFEQFCQRDASDFLDRRQFGARQSSRHLFVDIQQPHE